MLIDNTMLGDYGARLLSSYTVSGSSIDNAYYKGRDRSSFILLSSVVGLKTIILPVVLFGRDHNEIAVNKSRLDMALFGKHELLLPDGFFYTAFLEDAGELGRKGNQIAECTYTLSGIQHGPMITIKTAGAPLNCISTLPKTDCLLEVTVSSAAQKYDLNGYIFANVARGDVLTMDGIDKRVLINGGPAASRCEFYSFPALTPGLNYVTAPNEVTVKYYPTYQ